MARLTYRNYLLGVLTVVLLFNCIDRGALGILLQDIKGDLQLSDTQLGVLTGIAFAIFYSIMGIPMARWADRGNRVAIITATVLLWSIAVAACGLAASFTQLLLIRVAVAVGEAGCNPPAFSLIADYFSRGERPRAAAIYGMGGPLSALITFPVAGWLNEEYGWRLTFVLLGAPGLLLAVLTWSTLNEPRLTSAPKAGAAADVPSIRQVYGTLWANLTFRHLLLCVSVMYFFLYGINVWQPAFFMRSYGFTTGQLGLWLGLCSLGALVGSYLGGEFASRYAANNERLQLKAMAVAISACGVLSMLAYSSSNPYVALGLSGLAGTGLYMVNGPIASTIQTLVPERMRAVAFAVLALTANLIGMGLGPLAGGALSDLLRSWAGEESLRYGLVILSPGYFWCAWHVWRASTTVAYDLRAVRHQADLTATSTSSGVATFARTDEMQETAR